MVRESAKLRKSKADIISVYLFLCDIAEEHEIRCFTLVYDNEMFKDNNIEDMSEDLIDFGSNWFWTVKDFNTIKEQARETADCYYFLLLKRILIDVTEEKDHVNLHDTYPFLLSIK